ncbi:hypothetical protein KUL49_31140 [Alteromonas sp. KUL49]|nr:hypothetical protein KUL49_31140 [Alteromonas sp. KUL49]
MEAMKSQSVTLSDFFSRVILSKGYVESYYRMFKVFKEVLDSNNIEVFYALWNYARSGSS